MPNYEPHFVIDPLTGETVQLVAADRSAYALYNAAGGVETNRCGSVNIQIEWFFTPGTVYRGKQYPSLPDTPMLGLREVLEFTDSWGVPRVAPEPNGGRDKQTWLNVAGHYGHFSVPENDHSDPVCSIDQLLNHPAAAQARDPWADLYVPVLVAI